MFTATRHALVKLEYAATEIANAAGRPQLSGPVGRQWYRFPDEGLLQIVAVKAVRIVSGLNAAFRLLEYGFSVEAAVLLRTIDDFVDEITFLIEEHQSDAPTRGYEDFQKHFFEEVVDSAQLLEDRRRPDRVKRKKIQASQGRYLNPDNPDYSRRLVKAVDQGFDGYVHGAYQHSMELFDPNRSGGSFRFNGTDGTPYPASVRKHLAFYVSRTLSLFGMVALKLNRETLKEELVAARNRFEASAEYPGHSDE